MSHPMLKVAYQRGRASAVAELPAAEHAMVKEAISWRGAMQTARGMLNPASLVQTGAKAVRPAAPGGAGAALRGAAREGMDLTGQALRNSNLMSMAGKTGLGAGIGAMASDEGQRGRGAIIGALGGLGAHAGMQYGGGAAIAKRMKGLGARAGSLVQKGKLDPGQVQAWAREQMRGGIAQHGQIRNRVGQALLGTAGGVGATAAAAQAAGPAPMQMQQPFQMSPGFRPNYRL